MEFAKRELEKYGWQEGRGLGKYATGITKALKPNLKYDNSGIGHNSWDQLTNNWWETIYNRSSNNVNVIVENGEIKLKGKGVDSIKNKNNFKYGSFVKSTNDKSSKLGVAQIEKKIVDLEMNTTSRTSLIDDQLFAACKGRTTHKAARHGVNLKGKLSRLEMQEKLLFKKLSHFTLSDANDKGHQKRIEKKLKKIEYHKNKSEEDINLMPPTSPCILNSNSPYKCNKKRKGKHVSFSETVVEYQAQENNSNEGVSSNDLDSSSQSEETSRSVSPITNVKEVQINDTVNTCNESILKLNEVIEITQYDLNKEKIKYELQEKIRKENKRMRRKLKKLRKLNTIQESEVKSTIETVMSKEKCEQNVKWTKRKLIEELEDYDTFKTKRCHYENSEKLKRKKKLFLKQQQMEKNIDTFVNSFGNNCKISGIQNE